MLQGSFITYYYIFVIPLFSVIKYFLNCFIPTHNNVLDSKTTTIVNDVITHVSGYQFYNKSKFTFDSLLKDLENIVSLTLPVYI